LSSNSNAILEASITPNEPVLEEEPDTFPATSTSPLVVKLPDNLKSSNLLPAAS